MTAHDATLGRYTIRAVDRVCDILDRLQRNPRGMTLLELTTQLDMPKSTTFRYVTTLESRGYVVHDPTSTHFRLGPAFMQSDLRRLELLTRGARPHLVALRDRIDETVNLAVLQGSDVVYLDVVESRRTMRVAARTGDREAIHSTALGKALVASQDLDIAERLVAAADLTPRTSRTITEPAAYMRELNRVRRHGYALDNGENEADGRCVAVLLEGPPEPVAISISAPSARFQLRLVEQRATELQGVVKQILGVEGTLLSN